MRAKVNLRVEILDGEDAGYVLEETNRIVELEDNNVDIFYDKIIPHKISVEFVTPDQFRKKWIPLPGPCKKQNCGKKVDDEQTHS